MFIRFDEEKASQAASFFLKLRGGRMHYLKLIKLLYLADREGLLRWGAPITTDRFVSMDHGPVVSNIFKLINRELRGKNWEQCISPAFGDDGEVELTDSNPKFGKLSRAEENLMREIFEKYGHWNRWVLIEEVMHKLPEWKNPHGSSIPIRLRQILEAGGESEAQITAVINELRAARDSEETLSSLS